MLHQKKLFWIIFIPLLIFGLGTCRGKQERTFLNIASETARWIQASAVESDSGSVWPAVPGEDNTISTTLYSGTSGTILFFLEMFAATGKHEYLDSAEKGADSLLAELEREQGYGLYAGLSGMGFALQETYKAGRKERFKKGFNRCLERLKKNAVRTEAGISWGPSPTSSAAIREPVFFFFMPPGKQTIRPGSISQQRQDAI